MAGRFCSSAASNLQRLLWWLWTHLALLFAIGAGATITVLGYLVKAPHPHAKEWLEHVGGAKLVEVIDEWAPHFGPELMVLAFAAIFVEGALHQRERLRAVRFRTVQSLMYLMNYALQRHLYFDGGSSYLLGMEKDAIKQRSQKRQRTLWFDEQGPYDEAEKTAIQFIDEGLQFAWAVDRLDTERARLRIDLLDQQVHDGFWHAMTALEENAQAAFRRVPLPAGQLKKALNIYDLLEADRRRDWEHQITTLANSVPSKRDRLDTYFKNYWAIIEVRVPLLNKFVLFQAAVLAFRDSVWENSNPDE